MRLKTSNTPCRDANTSCPLNNRARAINRTQKYNYKNRLQRDMAICDDPQHFDRFAHGSRAKHGVSTFFFELIKFSP